MTSIQTPTPMDVIAAAALSNTAQIQLYLIDSAVAITSIGVNFCVPIMPSPDTCLPELGWLNRRQILCVRCKGMNLRARLC